MVGTQPTQAESHRRGWFTLELDEAINKRRTVRRFKSDRVPKKALAKLIDAAVQAPSGFNLQPWHFHVVGGQIRDEVASIVGMCTIHLQDALASMGKKHRQEAKEFFVDLGGAPTLLVVTVPCSDNWIDHVNFLLAAGCSIQNLMLKAHEEGLGTCCCTAAVWVKDQLSALLGIQDREIVSVLLVGYPDESPEAPPRDYEVVEWLDV